MVGSALAVATSVFVAATVPTPVTLTVDGLRAASVVAVGVVVAVWAASTAMLCGYGVSVVPALLATTAASVATPRSLAIHGRGAATALAVCVVVVVRAVRSSVGSGDRVHVVLALLAAAAATHSGPVSLAVPWWIATRGRALLLSSRCAQKTPAVVSGLLKVSAPAKAVRVAVPEIEPVVAIVLIAPKVDVRRDVRGCLVWRDVRRDIGRNVGLWRDVGGRVGPAPLSARAPAVSAPVPRAKQVTSDATVSLLGVLVVVDRNLLAFVTDDRLRRVLALEIGPRWGDELGAKGTHLLARKGVGGELLGRGGKHQAEDAPRHEQDSQKEAPPLRTKAHHLARVVVWIPRKVLPFNSIL